MGSGLRIDAVPYFRVFNPIAQAAQFDPENLYIRERVPEAGSKQYPKPTVDHGVAKERCLQVYKDAVQKNKSLA